MPDLRRPARARDRGAAGDPGARVHPRADRRRTEQGRDQGRAGGRVRPRGARDPRGRGLRPCRLAGPRDRDPALPRWRSWSGCDGGEAPAANPRIRRRRHSTRRTRSDSRPTWRATTASASSTGRDRERRDRRRLDPHVGVELPASERDLVRTGGQRLRGDQRAGEAVGGAGVRARHLLTGGREGTAGERRRRGCRSRPASHRRRRCRCTGRRWRRPGPAPVGRARGSWPHS